MRSLGPKILVALALVALLGGCGEDRPLPRITGVTPAAAVAGALIDVTGEGFAGELRQVSFGAASAEVRFWQPLRARVVVPDLAPGLTTVVVTIDGARSAPFDFEVASGE